MCVKLPPDAALQAQYRNDRDKSIASQIEFNKRTDVGPMERDETNRVYRTQQSEVYAGQHGMSDRATAEGE
jgi:hypothetical protein